MIPPGILGATSQGLESVVSPPSSIAADGSTDVSDQLATWITDLPAETVADLGSEYGSVYRIDRQVTISGKTDMILRNANLVVAAASQELDSGGRSTRRHVLIDQCARIHLENISVTGQNTVDAAGNPVEPDGQALYDSYRNSEHAVAVESSQNITVDGLAADAVFGDGASIRNSTDVEIRNFNVSRNGNCGIAVTHGTRIKILHGHIVNSVRYGIDLKPEYASDADEDVEVGHITMQSRLIPLLSTGGGILQLVHVHDIETWSGSVPLIALTPSYGGRRDSWLIENWQHHAPLGSPYPIVRAENVDDLTIRNSTIPAKPGRDMTGIELVNAGLVVLDGVEFPDAVKLVNVVSPAPNHDLTIIDCFPPA